MNGSNEEYLKRFLEGRELSKGSGFNYRFLLEMLDRFLQGKDFKQVDEDDLRRFIRSREHLKSSSRNREKILLKNFFRCLHGYRKHTYPPCVDWMVQSGSQTRRLPIVDANGILSEDDVKRIIEATPLTRDRALWMVLWEGGLRIGEALNMKMNSVVFDEYGCYAIVDGKTGQRRVRFVQATPYLREYINLRSGKDGGWLWLSTENNGLAVYKTTVGKNLTAAAKRAGLKKKVWPHLLRHSRLTVNAKFMTEAELCVFAGWGQGSSQTATYVHLAGVDLDDKILAHYGLKEKEQKKEETELKPLRCPRCGELNPATGKYCYKCSAALSLDVALRIEKEKEDKIEVLTMEQADMKRTITNLKQALIDIERLVHER